MSKHEETFEAILGPPPDAGPRLEDDLPDASPPRDGEPTLREAVEEWLRVAPLGVLAVPTFVSDLVLRNLSLAEQSVFQRIHRLAGAFDRPTPRTRPGEIGRACGLRTPLVDAALRALVTKGLLAVRRRNPLTGSARFLLTLPDTIRKALRICAICHRLIDEEAEIWLPAPLSLRPDGAYQYVAVHADCMEGATL